MAGNQKAPEDYSTNPNTVRARRRKARLQGEEKVRDDARTADYKALIVARKAVQAKEEFKNAAKPVQHKMLEQAMRETMEHRSKIEDYRAGDLAVQGSQARGIPKGPSIARFLEANGYHPPSSRTTAAAARGGNVRPGLSNHPQVPQMNSMALPSVNGSIPGYPPGVQQSYQPAMSAGADPTEAANHTNIMHPDLGGGFLPAFLKPEPNPFPPMQLPGGNPQRNSYSTMLIPPGQSRHQAQNQAQHHLLDQHHQQTSTMPGPFLPPARAMFNQPPTPASNTSRASTAATSEQLYGSSDIDAVRGVLENLVPTVTNLTRDMGTLRADIQLIRQELSVQKDSLGETGAKATQVEDDLRTVTTEKLPALQEAMGKMEVAVASLEAKIGQGADAEVAKMRQVMKTFQDALGKGGGY